METDQMTDEPLVSVIVPTYNRAAKIAKAVASLQNQTYRNIEILVVDDASTDDTADVMADIQANDPRVVFHRCAVNGGCSVARNVAMTMATGEYIAFLDDDDSFLPSNLSVRAGLLVATPEADVLVTGATPGQSGLQTCPRDWIEIEFLPHCLFIAGQIMCRTKSLGGISLRCRHMEWRDFAFQVYQKNLRVLLSSEQLWRKNPTDGSLSKDSLSMLSASLQNAVLYEEATRGLPEHDVFRSYLANCSKNMGNYSIKKGKLPSAVGYFLKAYRSNQSLRNLIPFT